MGFSFFGWRLYGLGSNLGIMENRMANQLKTQVLYGFVATRVKG